MNTLDSFGKPVVAKEEPKEPVLKRELSVPTVPLSTQDSHVYERLRTQPASIDMIDVSVEEKKDTGKHRLSLPEELERHTDKFAFRWLFKSKRAIDEACDIKGWVLVSRVYFPELPNHHWSVSGALERGDAILAFMPKHKADLIRKKPGEISQEIIKNTFNKHRGDPRYYKPQDSETGSNVVMI